MRHLMMVLILAIAGLACAGGSRAIESAAAAVPDDRQTQSSATTIQSFTAVEGPDLMAKLEAAQARGRTRQTPYWSAYAFDVRPGIAVDPEISEFRGNMNTIGDTSVFVGTDARGVTV